MRIGLQRLADKVMPKVLDKTLRGQVIKGSNGLYFRHQITSNGFDTVRIGIPKVKRCYICNHMNLKEMCEAIGATLHQIKYTTDSDSVAFSTDSKVLSYYYKIYGNTLEMYDRFKHTNGVWLIEFNGVLHWIIDYQRSSYISLELYGMSQLDHDKGMVRFYLLNRILGFYEPNVIEKNKPVLMGYDFHIDLAIDFDTAISRLIVPYLWTVNKTRKQGHKLNLHSYGTDKRSVYFQKKGSNSNRTICCYDKRAKNGLDYDLTRLEFSVRFKTAKVINSSKDLFAIQENELRTIGVL